MEVDLYVFSQTRMTLSHDYSKHNFCLCFLGLLLIFQCTMGAFIVSLMSGEQFALTSTLSSVYSLLV